MKFHLDVILKDPLKSARFVEYGENDVVLLGEYLPLFLRTVEKFMEFAGGAAIIFPSISQAQFIESASRKKVLEVIEDTYGVPAFIFTPAFSIYTNSRDDLTVAVCSRRPALKLISRMDEIFGRHVLNGGVGFGEEGRAYIDCLISTDSSLSLRFKELKRSIASTES